MQPISNNRTPEAAARQRKKVITAIIAIVMLATPVVGTLILYATVSRQTKQVNTTCQAHLAILGRAFLAYAKNHNDTLPQATNWTKEIEPYVSDKSAFRCPNDLTKGFASYAMNDALSGKKLSALQDTSHLVLLYEVDKSGDAPHGEGKDIYNIGHDRGGQGRHGADFYRFNYYLFANGQVTYPRAFKDTEQYVWNADGAKDASPATTPQQSDSEHPGDLTF